MNDIIVFIVELNMDDFRLVLIQVERRLSRSERERFLFIVAPYITRDEQKNSSTGGTLDVLQSLLEQERISPNDCSFLIDAFEKIECWTAANHLKNRNKNEKEKGTFVSSLLFSI